MARLGRDEFVVLLRDLWPARAEVGTAGQLLDRLRSASFEVHDVALAVDASIGVAVAPRDGGTVEELLQRADVAMDQAKRGQTCTAIFKPENDHHDVGQLVLMVELGSAQALVDIYREASASLGGCRQACPSRIREGPRERRRGRSPGQQPHAQIAKDFGIAGSCLRN